MSLKSWNSSNNKVAFVFITTGGKSMKRTKAVSDNIKACEENMGTLAS